MFSACFPHVFPYIPWVKRPSSRHPSTGLLRGFQRCCQLAAAVVYFLHLVPWKWAVNRMEKLGRYLGLARKIIIGAQDIKFNLSHLYIKCLQISIYVYIYIHNIYIYIYLWMRVIYGFLKQLRSRIPIQVWDWEERVLINVNAGYQTPLSKFLDDFWRNSSKLILQKSSNSSFICWSWLIFALKDLKGLADVTVNDGSVKGSHG
jgi:hypothetical protein